jgi:hypothetical protein
MLAACAAVLAATIGPAVKAAPIDGTTFLTFGSAVSIPGATLKPGTYIFERVDGSSDLDVVRVLSHDRSHVYLTQFTRNIPRPAGMSDRAGVTFGEADRGTPPPVKAWFPANEQTGQQFIY